MDKCFATLLVVAVAWTTIVDSAGSQHKWITTTALDIAIKANNSCVGTRGAEALRDCMDRVASAAARAAVMSPSARWLFGTNSPGLKRSLQLRAVSYAIASKGVA